MVCICKSNQDSMKYHFFNIFITSHFETDNLKFECLFDAQHYRDDRPFDVLTHVASEKKNKRINHVSHFRSDGNELVCGSAADLGHIRHR